MFSTGGSFSGRGYLAMSRDMVVMWRQWGRGLFLSSGGEMPGVLVHILCVWGGPPQSRVMRFKMSAVPGLRSPAAYILMSPNSDSSTEPLSSRYETQSAATWSKCFGSMSSMQTWSALMLFCSPQLWARLWLTCWSGCKILRDITELHILCIHFR